ncbi:uncharacterized protein FIBRA_08153 [Fibroporia radiculosa]|uniref:Histone-lysine N-methyltransferase, H3 lysine-36 specific n=1 Tax=Fibroporia radiculosa TaxID=599839 RepID=J4GWB0_9APHY|nr:uncharacterized protein FIBRA_08153 [Fibroporia radiculosa]CCM05915.1 predicted protein [Fibroporia radiculosa]
MSRGPSAKRDIPRPDPTDWTVGNGGSCTESKMFEAESVKPEVTDNDLPVGVKLEDAMNEGDGNPQTNESASRSVSSELEPSPKLEGNSSGSPPVSSRPKNKSEPQLIRHLPRAEPQALLTFEEIPQNHYQYGTLGRSRESLESMTCDCQYDPGMDDPDDACGHGSDCINRLTQVECLPDDCRCRSYCQNQRFQRKEYAPIEIVQTEKKGFGLRAAQDLHKGQPYYRDAFIYEYLGDVVSQPSFLKRMRLYAEEGIRHFYFMMLQKDEFIDATKRGGIGRFANHSCNPNCYVAKWTVGHHVRMGIFANRDIKKDEELTFNYNVDRYGHDAQPCYCGESNCVGFIGGKTQTDIAAMDDLYLDALGISEEVAALGLKGNKKKRSKKLDEDFVPTLKPIADKDVPKVVQALRQTQSRKVLLKLLTRIKLTENLSPLRQIMRLRGFSAMTNILEDNAADVEVSTLVIECMMTWPLIQRNKVEDSKVNIPVQICAQSDNQGLAELAQKLLSQWETLEYAYRIPKRLQGDEDEDDVPMVERPLSRLNDPRPTKKAKPERILTFEYETAKLELRPLGFSRERRPPVSAPREGLPLLPSSVVGTGWNTVEPRVVTREQQLAAIIAKAAAATTPPETVPLVQGHDQSVDGTDPESSRKKPSKNKKQTKEEKEANKEKRLLKLVGAVVVKCMSKYQHQMDHDVFKKHAKDLTHIIAEKEKKSSTYQEGKLDLLSDEKVIKIKKFAKEYIAKILRKLEKVGQRRISSSADKGDTAMVTLASGSTSTPNDASLPDISAEDTMDLDDDSLEHDLSPPDSASPPEAHETPEGPDHTRIIHVADPRLRHRNEECGWDPNNQDKLSVRQGLNTVSVGS